MSNSENKMSIGTKIQWIVTIALPIIFWLIPLNDVYTAPMRAFVCSTAFFICLAAFSLIPVLISGMLLPVLYVLLGAIPVNAALSTWSSSFLMWAVIGGFVFAYAIEESGLLQRVVYWAAIKCKGRYIPLVFTLMLVGYFLQFITFVHAWLLFIVLCYGIVEALDLKFTKQGILIMMVSQIVAAAPCVFMYSPGVGSIYQSGVQMIYPEYSMTWLTQIQLGWLFIPVSMIILFIFTKIYKVEPLLPGSEEYFQEKLSELGSVTQKEKWSIFVIALILLYLATTQIHGLDGNYAFVFFPALLFLPGINVGTAATLKKIDIGYIVFIASCMGIGTAGAAVGVGNLISTYCTPLLEGCPIAVFLIACLLLGIIMNLFMTPGAMLALLCGPLTGLGAVLGIANPLVPAMAMYFANELVFLPFENSYVLVMYGFNTMTMKDFMQYNIIKMVLFIVLFAVLILPYWFLTGAI